MVVSMFAALVALVVFLAGCASAPASFENPTEPDARVLVAELRQETNSFSPVPTTMEDFAASGIHRGSALLEFARNSEGTMSGFTAAITEYGEGRIEIVPTLSARAVSGGPIERGTYDQFKNEILEVARAEADSLDGVYLSLHGAMGVDGVRDPEGDLLVALRDVLGPDIPIGISFDLHANLTQRRADHATYVVGYQTNPHRDFFETGYTSGEIMAKTVLGQVKPVMVVRKMRLLKGGGINIDFLAPMRSIFRKMDRMERDPEVLSVSNFMVHIWLDDPELGWSTVAVTDGNPERAAELADEIADLDWEVRDVPHPPALSADEGVRAVRRAGLARAFGTTVICDVADAVGAGAPGENAWILKAFLENDPELTTYIPLRDAPAARQIWGAELGESVTLSVGRTLETTYNTRVTYTGEVIHKTETDSNGKTAVVKHQGIHLILTERPTTAREPEFFTDLGLPPRKADAVVVKNLFPFRFTYMAVNRKTINVMTPGTTSIDVFELEYDEVPRPIYPLDPIEDWRP